MRYMIVDLNDGSFYMQEADNALEALVIAHIKDVYGACAMDSLELRCAVETLIMPSASGKTLGIINLHTLKAQGCDLIHGVKQ